MTRRAALLALVALGAPTAAVAAPPEALPERKIRTLEAWVRGSEGPVLAKKTRFEVPADWDGDRERDRRSVTLVGPSGEGFVHAYLLLHPSELEGRLSELARRHPGSEPSPPAPLELPQIRTELGDRATRYPIHGMRVGEMALIERRGALVLFAVIVNEDAWASVSKWAEMMYRSVEVYDGPR